MTRRFAVLRQNRPGPEYSCAEPSCDQLLQELSPYDLSKGTSAFGQIGGRATPGRNFQRAAPASVAPGGGRAIQAINDDRMASSTDMLIGCTHSTGTNTV